MNKSNKMNENTPYIHTSAKNPGGMLSFLSVFLQETENFATRIFRVTR